VETLWLKGVGGRGREAEHGQAAQVHALPAGGRQRLPTLSTRSG
jgi:hypothetical protein